MEVEAAGAETAVMAVAATVEETAAEAMVEERGRRGVEMVAVAKVAGATSVQVVEMEAVRCGETVWRRVWRRCGDGGGGEVWRRW